MILRCNCRHEFQDERYGPYMRLHTEGLKVYRCTVCLNEKKK